MGHSPALDPTSANCGRCGAPAADMGHQHRQQMRGTSTRRQRFFLAQGRKIHARERSFTSRTNQAERKGKMKKIGLSLMFAGLLVISQIASATCQSNCSAQYDTCVNGCRYIQDSGRASACVRGCMSGYEGCKRRCGNARANFPDEKFLAVGFVLRDLPGPAVSSTICSEADAGARNPRPGM